MKKPIICKLVDSMCEYQAIDEQCRRSQAIWMIWRQAVVSPLVLNDRLNRKNRKMEILLIFNAVDNNISQH